MLKSNYRNKKGSLNKALFWLGSYWVQLSILAILAPVIYRYYLKSIETTKNLKEALVKDVKHKKIEAYSPTIQLDMLGKALKGIKFVNSAQKAAIIAAAKILPHHLGTQYMTSNTYVDLALNHLSWSENDKDIEKILIKYPNNYWILEKLYHDVYTPSRNLTADVLKFLDSDSLARVRASWKKNNKFL